MRPKNISTAAIRQVLDGNPGKLYMAFSWISAPQGEPYWTNRATGKVHLTDEDKEYLEWLIRPELEDNGEPR